VTPRRTPPVAGTRGRPVLASLLATSVLVAAVAVAGWLLLLLVKGVVVLIAYALGIAMIAVPLLAARRIVAGQPRPEQRRRVGTIATVVGIGAVLCAVAHLVGQHGWLLIAVPAAAVVLARLVRAAGARRGRPEAGGSPRRT
jgi:hypothetical protein